MVVDSFRARVAELADAQDLKSCSGSAQVSQDTQVVKNGEVAAANMQQTSPDLAVVVKAWGKLSPAMRAGILAMVKAAE